MDVIYGALSAEFLGKEFWHWALFAAIVLSLLVLDLGVFHKDNHIIGVRESLLMSAGYILIALMFGGWVWWNLGPESGINYLTGYLVEKTLAMDNIFVISLIFSYFAIPSIYQHRVLFWGILGVIVLRGLMIGLGVALVTKFSWILYLMGGFLIFTGIKMLLISADEKDFGSNSAVKFLRKHVPITNDLQNDKFFVKRHSVKLDRMAWHATPLFVALAVIEVADIVFAIDSIPAIFAITTDPYIVYTSNIFAILGLRALYFALAAMMHRFVYLKFALSAVLVFIGGKIFWNQMVGKMDPEISLAVTALILSAGIVFSLVKTRKKPSLSQHQHKDE